MTKPKNKPQTVGRKQWDGKDEALIIKKLEEAFAYDCTDIEACFYAGVSTQSLYKYQKKNLVLKDQKLTITPYDWLVPIGNEYPEIEKSYLKVRTNKKAISKELEMTLEPILQSWYTRQGSNLRPLGSKPSTLIH